jgi:asparagine synthase (glutamine-hydrolysing)
MCGIYGFADVSLLRASPPAMELLNKMARVVGHRGPDDQGHHLENGVALGMRRLSIIDLAGGHQPISNEDGTIWIVCNGEIYNFQELREDLEKKGHVFRCNSDVEAMVHLYEQEGIEFVKRLRGMFAFAIWDGPRSRLVLGRDRLGKKPLYVRRTSDRLFFASEIKSILQAGDVPRRVNPVALNAYLTLGYVPAPLTLFEGIEKVFPGHLMVMENGRIQDREYWEVRFDQVEELPEQEWEVRVRDKLLESVRLRLVSDVPLGAFLSGGIDSSSIVAAMARLTDRPVKTYSIGYGNADKYYNELPYAGMVARAFGTDHHEIIVKPQVSELLPRLIWHLDEPIADSAIITTYLVSRLARESVTVILSGVGGDELFGGYRRYLGDSLQRYYRWLPEPVRSKWLPGLLSRLPQDRHSAWTNNIRYATAFAKSAAMDPMDRYLSYVSLLSPDMHSQLLQGSPAEGAAGRNDAASRIMKEYFAKCSGADGLNQLMYVDIKTSLVDDLLTLTDKTSMAASVECRAPFMDHELVELAARMPSHLKVRGLTTKYLLKKTLKPWLPQEILHRKKRGFGAPVGSWLRDDLRFLTRELLSEQQVRKRGYLNWPVVQEIISSHEQQRSDNTDSLFALICFELWCNIFLDGTDWQSVQATPAQLASA